MRTLAQADADLAFLVKQHMVVVADEMVSIHPRLADVLTPLLAQADANESQFSTELWTVTSGWGRATWGHRRCTGLA